MPRSTSEYHASYVASRRYRLNMCRAARAMGNKLGLRMLQADALYDRENAGIGRPRCVLTARPLTATEIATIPLRRAA